MIYFCINNAHDPTRPWPGQSYIACYGPVLMHQAGLVSRLACRCFIWLAATVDASPSPQDCRVKASSRTCVSACLPLLPLACGHCGCITVPPPPKTVVLRHQAALVSRLACRCFLWLAATVEALPSPPKTVVLMHQAGLVSRLACRCFLWLAATVDASPSPQDCRVKASSRTCVSACLPLHPLACGHCGGITVPPRLSC